MKGSKDMLIKEKILIADADAGFRENLRDKMRAAGYQYVDAASDGFELREKCSDNFYNVIIADRSVINRSDVDFITKESAYSELYPYSSEIILMSGNPGSDSIIDIGLAQSAYCIKKPFEFAFMNRIILGLLEGQRLKSEAKRAAETSGSLEKQITYVIHQLGIPAHIKGYQFLRTAIIKAILDPDIINYVTKSLYPLVAQAHDTTPSRVERAIRHAIEVAWDRGDVDTLNSYFGYTISRQRGKPTNSEFIAMIADYIRLKNTDCEAEPVLK